VGTDRGRRAEAARGRGVVGSIASAHDLKEEGGFLGFGGELVSEREQQMLDTLGEIFG
jgi:hypothetical protein